MLLIGDQRLPDSLSTRELTSSVVSHPFLVAACTRFLSLPQAIPASRKHVWLAQRECGEVSLDEDAMVGSEDATTCCIIALVCSDSRRALVAHLDSGTCDSSTLAALCQSYTSPQLYMVGGYCDADGMGQAACEAVLGYFHHTFHGPVDVKLACIGALNTQQDGSPRCRELALDLRTMVAFPGSFEARGPGKSQRGGRLLGDDAEGLHRVCDAEGLLVRLPVYQVPASRVPWIVHLMQLTDRQLLEMLSTSPEHEGPNFVPDTRDVLRWVLNSCSEPGMPQAMFSWDDDTSKWVPAA